MQARFSQNQPHLAPEQNCLPKKKLDCRRFDWLLYVGYSDFWPGLLDGLLSTIADLAESIQEFVIATERAANYDSYQGEYM